MWQIALLSFWELSWITSPSLPLTLSPSHPLSLSPSLPLSLSPSLSTQWHLWNNDPRSVPLYPSKRILYPNKGRLCKNQCPKSTVLCTWDCNLPFVCVPYLGCRVPCVLQSRMRVSIREVARYIPGAQWAAAIDDLASRGNTTSL